MNIDRKFQKMFEKKTLVIDLSKAGDQTTPDKCRMYRSFQTVFDRANDLPDPPDHVYNPQVKYTYINVL